MTWNSVDLPEPVLPAMQRVLARAFADGDVLQLGRARAADGHAQFGGRVLRPQISRRREPRAKTALRRGWNRGWLCRLCG